MNGWTRFYLTLAVLGIFIGMMLLTQPYSRDWPGAAYASPARRFIQAGIRQDSAGLGRLSLSSEPVAWALDAGRARRLEPWRRRVQVWVGERRGDTTEVFVYPPEEACAEAPIVFRFVGAAADAKVLEAGSSCTSP
jgi:hypothetical protein